MKKILTLCLAVASLNTLADYHSKLKMAYEEAIPITLSELKSQLEVKTKCISVERENEIREISVVFKQVVIPSMGPLFPAEKFYRVLTPIETSLGLNDLQYRDNLHQENTPTGVVSKYNYQKTETQFRQADGMIVFFSKKDWSEWYTPHYCGEDPLCDEEESVHKVRTYGYCY